MRQSRAQKGARSKVQPPVVERRAEISRSKRRPHSQTPKTCRTEIRPRDCRRPTNTDSGSANDLRTNCAPCRRTLAAPTIRNRHSKKPADCARAGSGKRQRRVIRLILRQELPYVEGANRTFKKENAQRSTPNAQRPRKQLESSFRISFCRSNAGEENPNELFSFIEDRGHFRLRQHG